MRLQKHRPTYHWLILACCCVMAGITVGFFNNAYGNFYTPLSEHFRAGRGQVTVHATISLLLSAVASPLAIRAVQRFGARRMFVLSLFLQEMSLLLLLPATRIWQLNVLGVIRGVACSFFHVPIITMILWSWFFDHTGIAMGIVFSLASGFGALFSWMISVVIHMTDYRTAILVCAAAVLVLCLPVIAFVHMKPEEIGLRPHGWHEPRAVTTETRRGGEERETHNIPFYRLPEFYLLCAFALLTVPVISLQMHFSGFCEQIGAGALFGGVMMSTTMVGSVVWKLLIGEGVDVLGAFRTEFLVLAADIASLLLIFFNRSYHGNGAVLLVGGFLFGVHASIGSIGIASISRAVMGEHHDNGTAFSIVSGFASGGAACSITIFAAMYDRTQSYDLAFVTAIGLLAAGTVLLFILWGRKRRRAVRRQAD